MDSSKFCVIILNWNCAEDTIRCANLTSSMGWPVVVVDNGSDDPKEILSLQSLNGSEVFLNSENRGFAGGMNRGMREAVRSGFLYAFLLNPDTYPTAEVLEVMANAMVEGTGAVGIAQAAIDPLSQTRRYQSSAFLDRAKPSPVSELDLFGNSPVSVDVVTGACLLVDLRAAEMINYMDEDFFHYKEEFDFVFRLKRRGFDVRYCPNPVLLHRTGGSLSTVSAQARYYHYRNELLFAKKRFGLVELLRLPGLFKQAITEVISTPSSSVRRAIFRGLRHGIIGRTGRILVSS